MSQPRNQFLLGDAHDRLTGLDGESVDMVLTSPPYFQLRDYQSTGQLGVEPDVDSWVTQLRRVLREIQRVLVPTGSLWLNVGDSYAIRSSQGAAPKSLLLGPERLTIALLADGWIVRNKLVWQKANPMPTSVRDRFACTWEYVYILTKQSSYYFDLDSVRVPPTSSPAKRHRTTALVRGRDAHRGSNTAGTTGLQQLKAQGLVGHPLGKNPGDVLWLASSNYRGDHRATFPVSLAQHAVLAGCPEQRCVQCRRPFKRTVLRALGGTAIRGSLGATCDCDASIERGLVLDPFMGAGTTALAAQTLDRDWLGIELNSAYIEQSTDRIKQASKVA